MGVEILEKHGGDREVTGREFFDLSLGWENSDLKKVKERDTDRVTGRYLFIKFFDLLLRCESEDFSV